MSRRRSCTACVKAKTRCIEPADSEPGEACVRCSKRSKQCDLGIAVSVTRRPRKQASREATHQAKSDGQEITKDDSTRSSTVSALIKRSSNADADSSQLSIAPRANPDSIASLPLPAVDDIWKPDSLSDTNILNLENTDPIGDLALDSFMGGFSGGNPDVMASPSSLTSFLNFDLPVVPLFDRRVFNKPSQGPLVSLIMRILRSYPYMMLRKASLPPFVHPLVFSWAEAGVGHPQQVGSTDPLTFELLPSQRG